MLSVVVIHFLPSVSGWNWARPHLPIECSRVGCHTRSGDQYHRCLGFMQQGEPDFPAREVTLSPSLVTVLAK